MIDHTVDNDCSTIWVSLDSYLLKTSERDVILGKHKINDLIINYCQKSLHHQFPALKGLF